MSRHLIIPPTSSLIDEIASRFPTGSNDFSKMMIVFPGKRPAHFVRRALAERVGGSFIPPRIFSIDAFVDFLVAERLQNQQRSLDPLDAVALLFDIHRGPPAQMGGDYFSTLDRFIALGLKLYAELEELMMADVTPRRIREALGNVPLGRVHALPEYFELFYETVQQKNLSTRSLRYRALADAIENLDLSQEQEIILAGFYAYTRLEQRLVNSLVKRENVTFIAQQGPGLQKHLKSVGISAESSGLPANTHTPAIHFIVSPDTHGQVFAVTERMKNLLEARGSLNERTVIVLPTSDALFPIVHHTLPLLPPDGYNIALGYPLPRTPLFGFLTNLLTLATTARNGKVATSEYAAFILHPYTKNILFGHRADVTRILFHAVETFLADQRPGMFVDITSIEEENFIFDNVSRRLAATGIDVLASELKKHLRTIHDQTVRTFFHIDSLKDFAAKGIRIVQYIHKHSTATRHHLFRQYAERFLDLFATVESSLLASSSFADPASYAVFLRHTASGEEVPFPGTPLRGVQVLGLLETRSLAFDTVFLLNATDDAIPGGRSHDLLLPQALREVLGLETAKDRELLSEYYFNTLVAGAHEVHCFYTESGNHEKSRFLEKLQWEQQRKRHLTNANDLVQVVRYNIQLSTQQPDSVRKSRPVIEFLRKFEFTATALDTYLACPLRFYYAHVLKLVEKSEIVDDVDQREIGTLVHTALKMFFDGKTGKALARTDLEPDRLRNILDRVFDEQYGADLVGPAFLVKQQLMHQLEAYLTGYQIPKALQENIIVTELEQELTAAFDHYRFTGRVDRIERRGTRHVILDYKIGHNDDRLRINLSKLDPDDRTTWSTSIGSFQLVMYMLLYSHARRVSPEAIEPAYLFLGRKGIDPSIEAPLGAGQLPASDVYRGVQPIILKLIDEVLDASIDFTPADRLEKACPTCPYRSICGTVWVDARPY
jgi:hypothetical protein